MQRFKTAVFDLDGTLLDTSEGVVSAVRGTIERFGLKTLTDEQLMTFIGPPIQVSFQRYYGEDVDIQRLANAFREIYSGDALFKAVPYDGIYDAFSELLEAGIYPAVATYKRQDYALRLLKAYGFDRYTDIMFGADNENRLTKSDIIRLAVEKTGAVPENTVMIGDTDNDAKGAAEIGAAFVGVTYGFGFKSPVDVDKYPNIGAAANTEELTRLIIGEKK
ncbi:MAG: HAD hydrolase-like protein [Oscillospiraceae bacterium]|nr:HAD hydrolase-like protein [Oscillospiraceae bacterium]